MKEELNRLNEKVDKIDDRLDTIDKHLAVYNAQLEYHIRRTDQNEEKIEHIDKHVLQIQGMSRGIIKTLSVITAIGGIIAGAIKYFGVL